MANSYVSISQFKELLQAALEQPYIPRKGRNDSEHPAGEAFTEGGDTIHKIRIKFLLQDDGGEWGASTVYKPSFIWDLKKIVSKAVVDDGAANLKLNLFGNGIYQSNDGMKFFGYPGSYIDSQSEVSLSGLSGTNFVFNIWFTPSTFLSSPQPGILFSLFNSTDSIFTILLLQDPTNTSKFLLYVIYYDGYTQSRGLYSQRTQLYVNRKYNLLFSSQSGVHKAFINGDQILQTTANNLVMPSTGRVVMGANYKGEISYASIAMNNVISDSMLVNYWKFGYPLPRPKEYVDLSDNIEKYGKNLLVDVRTLDKVIENFKGELFVKTNNIKLRT